MLLFILIITLLVSSFIAGLFLANIRRLRKVGALLEQLDVEDPQFVGKIRTIDEFNYFI